VTTSPTRQSGPTFAAIREKPAPHRATSDPRQNRSCWPFGIGISSTATSRTFSTSFVTCAASCARRAVRCAGVGAARLWRARVSAAARIFSTTKRAAARSKCASSSRRSRSASLRCSKLIRGFRRRNPRHVVPKPAQAYETEVPVKVLEWIAPALASPDLVLDAAARRLPRAA
jgi:hypothetical protein